MLKYRLLRPRLSFFLCLPFFAALGLDLYIWQTGGIGFHFAEIGYLLQHYCPEYHDQIVGALDFKIWKIFLQMLFSLKATAFTGIFALLSIYWVNRRRHKVR